MMQNNRLSHVTNIYKPEKITIKGNVYILTLRDGKKIVLKEKNNNVIKAYNYLENRNMDCFVPIIDNNRDTFYVYPYLVDNNTLKEQKALDIAKTVGLMHAKTSFFKDVDKSKYDDIYDSILDNINYIKEYYSSLYDSIIFKEYYNPFENLFIDYYSKINNACEFSLNELEKWHDLIFDKEKQRVTLVHNNLRLSHFIENDNNNYLISFDKSKIDSPIIDLVTFYKNEYDNINFVEVFEKYLYSFNLNSDELDLFFSLISLPWKVSVTNNHYIDTSKLYELIHYLNKTEELIRPYYSNDEKEEE